MNCYSCRKYDTCPLGWKCSADLYGCSAYEVEQTNEEWFCQLPTEEKAKYMCEIYEMGKNGKEYFMRLDKAVEWLKQPHSKDAK